MWRQELDNPIITKSLEHFAVWHLLLLLATAKPSRVLFKGKERVLEPGQLVTTRKELTKLVKELGEYKVQRVLDEFEKYGQITQEKSNRGRLVTLVNWKTYQQKTAQQKNAENPHEYNTFEEEENKTAHPLHNSCTSTAHPPHNRHTNINNNVNKVNKVNKLDKLEFDEEIHNAHKPTIEEIEAYCNQQNYNINVKKFFDYYNRYGWKIQGQPLGWKAVVQKWDSTEYRQYDRQPKKTEKISASYDLDFWEDFSIFD